MVCTEDWYAQNGFSPDAARYFAGGVRKIASVAAGPDYTLVLVFDNGERRILDCKPEFGTGSLFNALRSPADFARVFLDENGNVAWDLDPSIDSSVHWANRIDICRDACYLRSVPAASASCPDVAIPPLSVAEPAPPPHTSNPHSPTPSAAKRPLIPDPSHALPPRHRFLLSDSARRGRAESY